MLRLSCVFLCLIHLCWSASLQRRPLEIEIFSFTAPKEDFQPRASFVNHQVSPSKIHQNVIFIKNPENQGKQTTSSSKSIPLAYYQKATSSSKSVPFDYYPKPENILEEHKPPSVSSVKQKLQLAQQHSEPKPKSKQTKYRGEPRNIQEAIERSYEERRIRFFL